MAFIQEILDPNLSDYFDLRIHTFSEPCQIFFNMNLEKPCVSKKDLVDAEVTEGEAVSLQCETSRPDSPEKVMQRWEKP